MRRGATQRDYRLLDYTFFRFPENPVPRHFSSKFSPRCARLGVDYKDYKLSARLQTTVLLDFTNSEIWPSRKVVCRLRTTFFQVSRVRRGATQRDYRLLYYKVFRFPENPEPRHFFLKIDYVLYTVYSLPRAARRKF